VPRQLVQPMDAHHHRHPTAAPILRRAKVSWHQLAPGPLCGRSSQQAN
jgi:hypothetical protein